MVLLACENEEENKRLNSTLHTPDLDAAQWNLQVDQHTVIPTAHVLENPPESFDEYGG
jgi:hypothetical protein